MTYLEFNYLGEKYVFYSSHLNNHSIHYNDKQYLSYYENVDYIKLFLEYRYLVLVTHALDRLYPNRYYFDFTDHKDNYGYPDEYKFIDLENVEEINNIRSIYSILE